VRARPLESDWSAAALPGPDDRTDGRTIDGCGGGVIRRRRGRSVDGGSLAVGRQKVGVKRKNGVGRPGAAHLSAVLTVALGSASRRGDLGSAHAHQWTSTGDSG